MDDGVISDEDEEMMNANTRATKKVPQKTFDNKKRILLKNKISLIYHKQHRKHGHEPGVWVKTVLSAFFYPKKMRRDSPLGLWWRWWGI